MSLLSSTFTEEHQRLLADCCENRTDNDRYVARFKYSNTTSDLCRLVMTQSSPFAKKRFASCSDLLSSSGSCYQNGISKTNDENWTHMTDNVITEKSAPLMDTSFWHPNYLIPPKIVHPLHHSLLKNLCKSCGIHLLGFIIGLLFSLVVLLLFVIFIPLKIIYYIINRRTYRGLYSWITVKNHCDSLWPWGSNGAKNRLQSDTSGLAYCDNSLLVITLQGSLETGQLMQTVWRKIMKFAGHFGDVDDEHELRNRVELVWSRDENLRLKTLDDFERFLKKLYAEPFVDNKYRWKFYIVTDFGDSECTFLILKQTSKMSDLNSCPLRLMCIMNDSKLFFSSCPQIKNPLFLPQFWVRLLVFLGQIFTVVTVGPVEVLSAAFRSPSTVWSHVEPQKSSECTKPKSVETNGGFQLTWSRLPNTDLLAHAEKVLRVSTQEILTSLVAGALRRYFKSCGIKHPPQLWIDVPLALTDDRCTVTVEHSCNFTLVPVNLAVDVDGAVPRAWETQRRMTEAMESSFWRSYKLSANICDRLLPNFWVRPLLSCVHSSCDGFVCFWRTMNELSVSNRKVYSVLMYPPLAKANLIDTKNKRGKFGFTFVQTGRDIMLSLLVSSNNIPDVNILLKCFQKEFSHLLKHLSTKMVTLTEISIYPESDRICEAEDVDETECDRVIVTQDEQIEELELLLATVQNELEQMKNGPPNLRRPSDYVVKLAQFDSQLETTIHHQIIDRVKSFNASKIPYEKQLGETSWYDVLTMYSRTPPERNRFVVKRKRSKRLSTPNLEIPRQQYQTISEWP